MDDIIPGTHEDLLAPNQHLNTKSAGKGKQGKRTKKAKNSGKNKKALRAVRKGKAVDLEKFYDKDIDQLLDDSDWDIS